MKIKAWLEDIGLLEPAVLIKLDSPYIPEGSIIREIHTITPQLQLFIDKAKKHYCEICDQFYKDTRGAKAHIRIRHKK